MNRDDWTVYKQSGGVDTVITDTSSSPFGGTGVSIEDGVVAFEGPLSPTPPRSSSVFAGTGGALTTIADGPNAGLTKIFGTGGINSSGAVVFKVEVTTPFFNAIMVGDGTSLQTIADESDPRFDSTLLSPGINSSGKVAFVATGGGGPEAIYVADAGVVERVVAAGDSLDDDLVTAVSYFGAIDDQGRIAFRATLNHGARQAIFIADPTGALSGPCSEPPPPPVTGVLSVLGTWGAVALMALLLGVAGWRRRTEVLAD